ncbi:MAG: ubiquinol-cytochrome c reductase iron-sulfur subunit [Phycisphaerae bacterium]
MTDARGKDCDDDVNGDHDVGGGGAHGGGNTAEANIGVGGGDMERRSFIKRAVVAVNGLIALVVAVPAVRYLIDPVFRSGRRSGFIRVAPLSALSRDHPLRVTVVADRQDAYTRYPPGPIGQVFLLLGEGSGGEPTVRCLQVICPHLGCAVEYRAERTVFACPCHASEFDAAGRRLSGPAPRHMDELPCRVVSSGASDDPEASWVEVKYEVFRTGIAAQRAIG